VSKLKQFLKRILFDEASSEIWVLNSEFLQKKRIEKHSNNAIIEKAKPLSSLKQLIDSYTDLSFFKMKHGFLFFPKTLSKYFRSRKDKLDPLILGQFSKLLKEQEILHFQKIKTANDPYNFSHFLAKFTQMKIIDELLENSLDKMCYKSFSFLTKFVRILKKQNKQESEIKLNYISSKNPEISKKVTIVSNQLLNIMRMSFLINKKHNRFKQYILLPVYLSGKLLINRTISHCQCVTFMFINHPELSQKAEAYSPNTPISKSTRESPVITKYFLSL
jgi:hypothetical protein